MSELPRISVITASYNQGRFIADTVESVLAQDYPNLEHIVVDGMSTDETPEILSRYKHLRVIREPDKGHADAVNKGFRIATGDVYCFLNSDDTFLPGAFDRVAREIDPAHGRHVVMGRCRFIDEQGRYFGVEHPSHFESFRRILEVWKGHLVPQPAVFWTPTVWNTCGPLRDCGTHIDYDLFCRFARRYNFHKIDQVLATYRLHEQSKTRGWSDADRLEDSIRISRQYWGSLLMPLYWQLTLSLAIHRFNRPGRAQQHYNTGEELARHGHRVRSYWHKFVAGFLAPDIGFYALLYPSLHKMLSGALRALLDRMAGVDRTDPQTAVYLDRTDCWEDGWAGPRLVLERQASGGEQVLLLQGDVQTKHFTKPLVFTVLLDGEQVAEVRITEDGSFGREIRLSRPLQPGQRQIEIRANTWVVYHRILRNGDYRPLVWRPAQPEALSFRSHSSEAIAMPS